MIEAQGLTRHFGAVAAVEHISLRVPDGTILALLGPNGAGKTTTVRMLAGLIAPTAGDATVAGYDIRRDAAAVRARVGLVTDSPGLYPQMDVMTYLDFFGRIYGLSAAERARRIAELLAFFELADQRRKRLASFSKGMQQKVALARALLHDPIALFLDEPTSGLDPLAARAVRELVLGLKHSSRSIILCTHDLDEAERIADLVAIIRQGRLIACDTPAALRANASPETIVRVELAAPHPGALAALRVVDGVRAPTETGDGASVLTYSTADPTHVNPVVIARLVAAGALVVSLSYEHLSLEDVYVAAMGAQASQDEPVAATSRQHP
jgi:ABC-2 type transport system ATP-binding protein